MPKASANLSVDPAVLERGKLYGRRHGTSVSQLVGDFLANLPDDETGPKFTGTVALLYGIARAGSNQTERPHMTGRDKNDAIDDYHDHLVKKYGSK